MLILCDCGAMLKPDKDGKAVCDCGAVYEVKTTLPTPEPKDPVTWYYGGLILAALLVLAVAAAVCSGIW